MILSCMFSSSILGAGCWFIWIGPPWSSSSLSSHTPGTATLPLYACLPAAVHSITFSYSLNSLHLFCSCIYGTSGTCFAAHLHAKRVQRHWRDDNILLFIFPCFVQLVCWTNQILRGSYGQCLAFVVWDSVCCLISILLDLCLLQKRRQCSYYVYLSSLVWFCWQLARSLITSSQSRTVSTFPSRQIASY